MSSLIPLIQDILPMILPASISVTKGKDLLPPPLPPSPPAGPIQLVDLEEDAKKAAEEWGLNHGPRADQTKYNGGMEQTDKDTRAETEKPGEPALDESLHPATLVEEAPRIRVVRKNAIVDKSDSMCASVLFVRPNSISHVHHHGEQETIIYAASGKGLLLSHPRDEDGDEEDRLPQRYELEQGDFAFIPAWTEHQAVNESDVDLVWVLIQNGSQPVDVNLTGWGGPQVKGPPEKPPTLASLLSSL